MDEQAQEPVAPWFREGYQALNLDSSEVSYPQAVYDPTYLEPDPTGLPRPDPTARKIGVSALQNSEGAWRRTDKNENGPVREFSAARTIEPPHSLIPKEF